MQDSGDLAAETAKLGRRLDRERKARYAAEAIAEQGLRDLYEKQRQLQLLETIAVAANQTGSVKDILKLAVATVCQFTGWAVGHAYLPERYGDDCRLVSTRVWHVLDPDQFRDFCDATEALHFGPGVGLPGRVLQKRAPAWITDVAHDDNFPRLRSARDAGITAAFAFPVQVGNDVAAILEFFTDHVAEPDQQLLALMAQVSLQIGRVVERARAEEKLIYDATHDPLTGLPNRALFMDRLTRAVGRNLRPPGRDFAVLFIDLDRFKVVNDSLGHAAGDQLITQVAMRIQTLLRRSDIVTRSGPEIDAALARLGGDEFTVLLDDVVDSNDAVHVADRIKEALDAPFSIDGQDVCTTASIGVVSSGNGYTSALDILRDADLAMYRAKAKGKARYEIYDQTMHAMAIERLALESDLRRALRENEFVLHYQPIVSLSTRQIVGFEALVRWQRSKTELVFPDEFISAAEDTGLILFLGNWVLREACVTMRRWQKELPGCERLTICINVSVRQFAQPDLVRQVSEIIRETAISPETVRLEITESLAMVDAERTSRILSELRELGVQLAIDDFGTGYSSLSYLHRYPLDALKIDRSFVSRMDESAEGLEIVHTIVNLARNIGIDVIAEGVESEAHITGLKVLGCELAQGFVFSKAVDGDSARALLQSGIAAAPGTALSACHTPPADLPRFTQMR